ncbi:hypothetical protein L917_17005 [Phytophthora nicotianae]|uniref:Uncharacterized protein n=1 Tax=Phytophthora nicotianae TaxID=4792 RepID=W2KEC4_PHYNI|nr:hypothetical protein L917_17005 [Phytophthora nicotianae]
MLLLTKSTLHTVANFRRLRSQLLFVAISDKVVIRRSDLQLAKNWRGSVLLKAIAEKANRYMIHEKGTGCG